MEQKQKICRQCGFAICYPDDIMVQCKRLRMMIYGGSAACSHFTEIKIF